MIIAVCRRLSQSVVSTQRIVHSSNRAGAAMVRRGGGGRGKERVCFVRFSYFSFVQKRLFIIVVAVASEPLRSGSEIDEGEQNASHDFKRCSQHLRK